MRWPTDNDDWRRVLIVGFFEATQSNPLSGHVSDQVIQHADLMRAAADLNSADPITSELKHAAKFLILDWRRCNCVAFDQSVFALEENARSSTIQISHSNRAVTYSDLIAVVYFDGASQRGGDGELRQPN